MSLESELVRQINSLQKQVDALVKPEVGRWIDWTPTVTQSIAITVTVDYAKYIVIGNTVQARGFLSVTSAGVAGNAVVIGNLPFSIFYVGGIIGVCEVLDSGVAFYNGVAGVASATTFVGRAHNQTSNIGVTPSFALANGDSIRFNISYERA